MLKKMQPSARQLLPPLQNDEPVPIPIEKQQELEQVLADLLLRVANVRREVTQFRRGWPSLRYWCPFCPSSVSSKRASAGSTEDIFSATASAFLYRP